MQNQSLNQAIGQTIDKQPAPTIEQFDTENYWPRLAEAAQNDPGEFNRFTEDLAFRDMDFAGQPITVGTDLSTLDTGLYQLGSADEGIQIFVMPIEEEVKRRKSRRNQ